MLLLSMSLGSPSVITTKTFTASEEAPASLFLKISFLGGGEGRGLVVMCV